MAEQTSVEWFLREIGKYMDTWNIPDEVIEKAYEMHKKEIKQSWLSAWKDSMINPLEDRYYEPEAEQYYNETFKQ
jgi:hypothetical protein